MKIKLPAHIQLAVRRSYIEGKSAKQLATEYKVPIETIKTILGPLYTDHQSKMEYSMSKILSTIYPADKILEEHNLEGLFLDFYIPRLRLAFECDGEQHFKHNTFFHGGRGAGKRNFIEGLLRDQTKEANCTKNYIYLIRIPYTDAKKLNTNFIKELIDEHMAAIISNLEAYNRSLMHYE